MSEGLYLLRRSNFVACLDDPKLSALSTIGKQQRIKLSNPDPEHNGENLSAGLGMVLGPLRGAGRGRIDTRFD